MVSSSSERSTGRTQQVGREEQEAQDQEEQVKEEEPGPWSLDPGRASPPSEGRPTSWDQEVQSRASLTVRFYIVFMKLNGFLNKNYSDLTGGCVFFLIIILRGL